mmetsp:Transcript_7642/g.10041  ORF Transcript_7642/g.10041 Transcript_7642/m.10041 type:complete len:649 (+) Transcript_7642:75-2021(+)
MATESYYQKKTKAVEKERDELQEKVVRLEADNQKLKKTVYELSYQLSQQTSSDQQHFNLNQVLDKDNQRVQSTAATGNDSSESKFGILDLDLSSHDRKATDRILYAYAELRGHKGAVYTGQFSKNGLLAASGGLDKIVRVWDVGEPTKEGLRGKFHQQLVSSVAWGQEESVTTLLSGSFDARVTSWDLQQGNGGDLRPISNVKLHTMVKVVEASSKSPHLAYAACNDTVALVDFRMKNVALWAGYIRDGGAKGIRALHSLQALGGSRVLGADREGTAVVWDFAAGGKVVEEMKLEDEDQKIQVAQLQVVKENEADQYSPPTASFPEPHGVVSMVVASCYDNTLRVFQQAAGPHQRSPSLSDSQHHPSGMASPKTMHPPTLGAMKQNSWHLPPAMEKSMESFDPSTPRNSSSVSQSTSLFMNGLSQNSSWGSNLATLGGDSPSADPFTGKASPFSSETPTRAPSPPPPQQKTLSYPFSPLDSRQEAPAVVHLQLTKSIRGHQAKSWPIGCSVYRGKAHRWSQEGFGSGFNSGPPRQKGLHGMEYSGFSAGNTQQGNRSHSFCSDWEHSLLLASGSGNGNIFIHDIANSGNFLYALQGHTDRVYTVNFHAQKPLLITTSADSTVRIWSSRRSQSENTNDLRAKDNRKTVI